jgi:hypothetical protein
MEITRRQILAGVSASLATGGCLSGSSTTSSAPATTPRNTDPTASPDSAVEVPPCPAKPDSLSETAAADFAEQFEVSYVTRTVLAETEHVTHFEFLRLTDPEVHERSDARFVVRMEAAFTYGYRQNTEVEDTVTGDSGRYRVSYLVAPETTKRARDRESSPDPADDGKLVTCPP